MDGADVRDPLEHGAAWLRCPVGTRWLSAALFEPIVPVFCAIMTLVVLRGIANTTIGASFVARLGIGSLDAGASRAFNLVLSGALLLSWTAAFWLCRSLLVRSFARDRWRDPRAEGQGSTHVSVFVFGRDRGSRAHARRRERLRSLGDAEPREFGALERPRDRVLALIAFGPLVLWFGVESFEMVFRSSRPFAIWALMVVFSLVFALHAIRAAGVPFVGVTSLTISPGELTSVRWGRTVRARAGRDRVYLIVGDRGFVGLSYLIAVEAGGRWASHTLFGDQAINAVRLWLAPPPTFTPPSHPREAEEA